jgi:hypothetical protein
MPMTTVVKNPDFFSAPLELLVLDALIHLKVQFRSLSLPL